jgi:AcrR family transcriptional regulator
MTSRAPTRKLPQQERSRERVATILDAARELIGTRGNDAVSMREIAARAGVPIASVYQYFSDKNAILRTLMIGYLDDVVTEVGSLLDAVTTPEELPDAIDRMVDIMVRLFREKRDFPTIWAAVQANTTLRELDAEDGRRIAEFLIARFLEIAPHADPMQVRAASLHAVHTIGTTVRVAVLYSSPEDAVLLLDEFKTIARMRVRSILLGDRA